VVRDGGKSFIAEAEIVVEARKVFPAMACDVRRCGRTGGEPLLLVPVREIVPRLIAGPGVVAHLVAFKPGSAERGERCGVHLDFEVLIGGGELAAVLAGGHRRVGFVREVVAGEVRGSEGERGVEVGLPIVEGLARDAEDEIDGPARDARVMGDGQGAGNAGGIVPALERLEVDRIE
jgi:hypothetical protein